MATLLKLLIVFPKVDDDLTFVRSEAKKFFEGYNSEKNLTCTVDIGRQAKNIDVDLIYKAGLTELEVILEYKEKPDFHCGDQFKNIVKNWCDSEKNELSNLWLRFADRSVLKNKGKQVHGDVDVKEIAFGTTPNTQTFMQHYQFENKNIEKELSGSFFHNQRYFIIYLCPCHEKRCQSKSLTYKFRIVYHALMRVIINDDPDSESLQLYFVMKHIPLIYKEKKNDKDDKEVDEIKSGNRQQFLASDQEYQQKKWERSLTFGCSCNNSLCEIDKVGRCPVFKVAIPKTRAFGIVVRLIQRCTSNTSFYFSCIQRVKLPPRVKLLSEFDIFPFDQQFFQDVSDKNFASDIKFNCQYAWEVMFGRSLEVKDQVILKYITHERSVKDHWESIKKEIQETVKHKDALVNTLYHISDIITRQDVFVFEKAFRKLYEHYRRNPSKIDLPDGMCLVRRLIMMPSRIICLQPMEHFDNRVIREFGSENILRVSIQDDDFSKLTFAVQYHTQKDKFMERFTRRLIEGVRIGPRHYNVLAASNSQLREHGLYLFAKDCNGNTAENIRKWMGNFSHIENVAKYVARLGQCFSTSEEAVQIKLMDEDVISIQDIKNDKYTFSDGVGMISTKLAKEIRKAFRDKDPLNILDEPIYNPSAYQIRFKGCKGMVTENPNLEGRKLATRPSMEKFFCESSNMLEIVKISAPRALFLNRPLISLLEQLGISANVFLKLQKKMVMDLTDSLIYERKGRMLLANRTGLDFPYKKLLNSGICLTKEPFFRRLLLSVYTVAIDQLRSKARIFIPPKFGRNMLGVIDETGTLNYGEVFVQYSEEIGNQTSPTHVLTETIVVTKNPCMHPGDVRKLEAVDVPELRHIKDCIVFPAHGPRPHPDEMAGSDLDGDEYVIIWHPDLIFQRDNCKPMNYPPNEEKKHVGTITVREMVNFLSKYIQNDNIGVMANAYLAWADWHNRGIFSKVCSEIAQKYPRALDFAKSGTTEYLTPNQKPKLYPDFMEKGSNRNSYKSKRALGPLYRVTRSLEACISKVDIFNQEIAIDEDLVYPGYENYEESAEIHRREYVKRIKNILKKYGLRNEAEVLSGYIGRMNDYNENRYDRDNALSVAKTYIKDAIKHYRYKFEESFYSECATIGTLRGDWKEIIRYRRASAWYIVTYRNPDKSVLSFPWILSDILCDLREKVVKTRESPIVPKSSFIDASNKSLNESFARIMQTQSYECHCYLILRDIIGNWFNKSSSMLTMSAEESFCIHCLERIFNKFRALSGKTCCSIRKTGDCECEASCSPTKLILDFMKFYATEVVDDIGVCGQSASCDGFGNLNLQSLALQSYATLAVTRNIYTLTSNEKVNELGSVNDCEEGDPIRVSIPKGMEDIITHHDVELSDLLKTLSGVKDIFMSGDKDYKNNWHILVHSIGKPHQRWSLEELIMDEKIDQLVRSKLKLP
ncbi:uncharacterized protein [Parasteatoda tepidariorum]|uniref:uncharacterized protein n=1 Tax=Parasteatoda tepidariorum TaxID=114398 RepID=UPI001C720E9C|nr:probable RNA-dependent RNA polymerase SHL2 [Parasteatoda tepidariorum]XP_042910270.1 probable RNA-dependent RNA polymerase SHL2 [Parasteatoda tepidariorum]XP_042910271.1 probable RNA-dependent RNA polymerase SHL2 [Parasteatoda tepidariorum]